MMNLTGTVVHNEYPLQITTALVPVVFFCRSFITAAEAKLKAELKSTYLTQLDKKRLTMCKQELVGEPEIHTHAHTHTHTHTENTFNINTTKSLPWRFRWSSLSVLHKQIQDLYVQKKTRLKHFAAAEIFLFVCRFLLKKISCTSPMFIVRWAI